MDWLERLAVALVTITVLLCVGIVVMVTQDALHTNSGVVVDKYYDDPDLVCSKGCVITSECWRIVVEGAPWFENGTCVSEEHFQTVDIGDNFKEN